MLLRLSSDYSTVSIYFQNRTVRTFTDVAKVQGGQEYQTYMKDHFDNTKVPNLFSTPWYCPFPHHICRHLPRQSDRTHNPLRLMLKTLLSAAETVLQRDVKSVMVSTHVTQSQDHWETLSTHVSSALKDLKVDRWDDGLQNVVATLDYALHFGYDCNREDRNLMAIEYTRDSLVGQIWNGKCRTYETLPMIISSASGHDEIAACRRETENAEICNAPLRSALRDMIETSGHPGHQLELSDLLIFGEQAKDRNFLMALVQSVQDSFVNVTSIDTSEIGEFSPDLAFAGSRAMAGIGLETKIWDR